MSRPTAQTPTFQPAERDAPGRASSLPSRLPLQNWLDLSSCDRVAVPHLLNHVLPAPKHHPHAPLIVPPLAEHVLVDVGVGLDYCVAARAVPLNSRVYDAEPKAHIEHIATLPSHSKESSRLSLCF